jgi:hypothetical protein
MSASSSTEYPILEATDSISVNSQTEYQPANQQVTPLQSHSVKYNPVNGGKFTKHSDFIQFSIRPQKNCYIDGSKTVLNLKFKALPDIGTSTTQMGIYSTRCGIQGAISQLVVTNSGNTLEFVTGYNRAYAIVSNMYASSKQFRSAPSVTDITNDATNGVFGRVAGIKMSPTQDPAGGTALTCEEYECSVPISLSALFGGSSKKCIPIGKLNEPIDIKLYLTSNVNDVYMSKDSSNGSANYDMDKSDYQITDVSLECHQVRFTDSVDDIVSAASGGKSLTWDCDQLSSSFNNINPTLQQDQILLSNTQFNNVKSIMNGTYYSQQVGNTVTYASLQPGIYLYNCSVDGAYLMARDVGTNSPTSLHNSDALFAANLLSITRNACDLWESGNQLSNGAKYAGRHQPYDITDKFYPTAGPSRSPSCVAGDFLAAPATSNKDNSAIDSDYLYTGLSTLVSKDMSRELKGRNFKGKQVVMHLRRHNRVTDTTPQIYHSLLHIGCKMILEDGMLRREC